MKSSKVFRILGFVTLIVVLGFVFSLYINENNSEIQVDVYKGFSISPSTYDSDGFNTFIEIAKESGNTISWTGLWRELSDETSAAYSFANLASDNDMEYIPIVGLSDQGNTKLDVAVSEEEEFAELIKSFVQIVQPKYVGIGIEVNRLHDTNQADYARFVSIFNKVAAEIPSSTRVFTIFQLENLKGLHGGLFGKENNPENAKWNLINDFPEADSISFTTYPGLIYKDPGEIPLDHYTEIAQYTNKQVLFTEIGWFREVPYPGWESNVAEQAMFINRLKVLIDDLDYKVLLWSFLFDQTAAPEPFGTMGLLSEGQVSSDSLKAWQSF
jgi:hypothetical protein